jgi:hypothetical protein
VKYLSVAVVGVLIVGALAEYGGIGCLPFGGTLILAAVIAIGLMFLRDEKMGRTGASEAV